MSKKAKIIIIIIAALVLFMVAFILIQSARKDTPVKDTVQNLFPFGQPQTIPTETPGSGLGTDYPGASTGEPTETPTTETGTTGGSTSTGGGTSGGSGSTGTTGSAGGSTTTVTTGSGTTNPTTTPTTPSTGTPAAATPSLPTLTATAAPILQARPTTDVTAGINCYSRAGNTCFNKIEAAIYYAKAELAEIDQIITMLRGNAQVESVPNKLMKLDHCIPGPDYGFVSRIQSMLENNEEWKSIGANGSSTFDIRKKAGVNLEINDTINAIRAELAFTSKNLPMAQDGFSFINATPKYNEVLRDYRDRQLSKIRTLAALEKLNTEWKTAKSTQNTQMQQQVTTMFANFGTDIPTQEAWYEAANTREKLAKDVDSINGLQNRCSFERNQYRTAFASQQTYIASKVTQPLRDIVLADESKRLYCPIDKYHVNNISREISGTLLYQIAVNDNTVTDNPSAGPGWTALYMDDAGSNLYYEPLNTQEIWLDGTVFYPIDQISLQAQTLRSLLQKHNPEMGDIGTIQDQENAVGGQSYFDNPDYANDVLIDDHVGLQRHSLYSFGISCEAIYRSSRFDYIDELTQYGF